MFLWNCFFDLTKGNEFLTFQRFFQVVSKMNSFEKVNGMKLFCASIFNVMDLENDGVISFREFLVTLNVICRGCMEAKFEGEQKMSIFCEYFSLKLKIPYFFSSLCYLKREARFGDDGN